MGYVVEYEQAVKQAQMIMTLGLIFGLILAVVMIISMWKIFSKAGKPGWASIIPIYNLYVLYEISWGKGIYFLLLLVPFVNAFIGIITVFKLGQNFGKSTGFIIGMIFLPIVFMPMLAFSNAVFMGIADGRGGFAPVGGYAAPYPGYGAPQGYPQQGMPQGGQPQRPPMPPQGYPQQAPQGYPPQGGQPQRPPMSPQSYSQQGQGAPQGYPQQRPPQNPQN